MATKPTVKPKVKITVKPTAKPKAKVTTKPKPPMGRKPSVPPDYDVIIPGYNDRATVNRLNREAAKRKKTM